MAPKTSKEKTKRNFHFKVQYLHGKITYFRLIIWKLFQDCLLNHKAVAYKNFRTCMCMPWIITGNGSHNHNTEAKANKTWKCDTIIQFPCLHSSVIKEVVYFLPHLIYNQHYKWTTQLENKPVLDWFHKSRMRMPVKVTDKNCRTVVAKCPRNSA